MQKAFEILLQTSDISLQVPIGSRICGDHSSSAFGSASDILDNFADPAEPWVSLDTGVLREASSGACRCSPVPYLESRLQPASLGAFNW
jgi:hypothetical protein